MQIRFKVIGEYATKDRLSTDAIITIKIPEISINFTFLVWSYYVNILGRITRFFFFFLFDGERIFQKPFAFKPFAKLVRDK